MMKLLVVVALVSGCSSKKQDAPPEPKPGTGSGSGSVAVPAAPDAACLESTKKLQAWLTELVAEGGQTVYVGSGLKLVELADAAPKPIASAPVVTISANEVSFQGKLLSTIPIKDKGLSLKENLEAVKATDTLFVIDAAVPWSDVVTAVTAASAAGHDHITFVFAAGAPSKTTTPPASAIDKELEALANPDASGKAARLADPADPNFKSIPDKVFKDCPIKDELGKIGAADSKATKDTLVVEGIPKAIAACGCKVEIASVQRLMWAWYGRDAGKPMLGVSIAVAANGEVVSAKPAAAWSEASKAVADAAKAGKPITLKN